MYAERIAGTRFVADEREGTLRLRLRESDSTTFARVAAVVAFAVVGPGVVFMDASSTFPPLAYTVAWTFLLLTGVLYAQKVLGPARSRYGRVRRTLDLRLEDGKGGYRDGAARGTMVIDGKTFDRSEVRKVVVVVLRSEVTVNLRTQSETDYLPTVVFRDVAYELERFSAGDEEQAQMLADVIASACAGEPRAATIVTTPPWNVMAAVVPAVLVGGGGFVVGLLGLLDALREGHRALGVAAVLGALALDVAGTELQARVHARARAKAATPLFDAPT